MPKDATKNVDRYKIRGGQLNEFEYTENQKALAKEKSQSGAKLIPGTPPEKAGDGLRPAVKTAAKKSTTKSRKATSTKIDQATKSTTEKAAKSTTAGKATKSTKTGKVAKSTNAAREGTRQSSTQGASAKKLAARKAAKK